MGCEAHVQGPCRRRLVVGETSPFRGRGVYSCRTKFLGLKKCNIAAQIPKKETNKGKHLLFMLNDRFYLLIYTDFSPQCECNELLNEPYQVDKEKAAQKKSCTSCLGPLLHIVKIHFLSSCFPPARVCYPQRNLPFEFAKHPFISSSKLLPAS